MTTPFEIAIKKLAELGFFQFLLPYMITAAIFFGLLRKSRLFGPPEENVVVNGVVALSAALLVWASPILLGIDIQTQLASFIVQGFIMMLAFTIGLMITSLVFGPNLPEQIISKLKAGSALLWIIVIVGILLGFSLLFTSGLYSLLFPQATAQVAFSEEVVSTLIVIIFILAIMLIFAYLSK